MPGSSPVRAATAGKEDSEGARPRFEVADVVRRHGAEFLATHATSAQQRRVLRAIVRCRTAALGGHVEQCEGCAERRIAYNSCRNRHCPKCQGKERARWMAAEQAHLLPVPYFHLVFTLPHALGALIRSNPRRLYSLLFTTAAATLRQFALDPRYLGAEPAITMVLHTWGQTLTQHVHVHCVISAAGLSLDGRRWVALRRRRRAFLFPVRALSRLFRGKYIAALELARRQGKLRFSGQSAALAEEQDWQPWIATLSHTDWVVYAKPPFGGAEQVLKYLSRYTHRIAISNHRILFVGDGLVRFTYKDYADHHRTKVITLGAGEFLRRFLLHVLPRGFMRIRHYGILANCRRQQKLARCRELLGVDTRAPSAETSASSPNTDALAPDDYSGRCPQCGGRLRVIEILPPQPIDSS